VGAVRSGLGFLSWVGAVVIVIALVLKAFVFDMAEVGHNGMAPTLIHGERVLINKRADPVIGSIAVCRHPTEDGWVVGRVVATGGMVVDSAGGKLRVDGEPVVFDEKGKTSFYNADNEQTTAVIWGDEYVGAQPHRIFIGEDRRQSIRKTEVPGGTLYLLGDHRAYMGQDSRAYGPVDASECRGTIVFRVTPVDGLDQGLAHGYFEPIG
jgi:signal peptidase I